MNSPIENIYNYMSKKRIHHKRFLLFLHNHYKQITKSNCCLIRIKAVKHNIHQNACWLLVWPMSLPHARGQGNRIKDNQFRHWKISSLQFKLNYTGTAQPIK
ncbi:hypothetical protein EUGRSUZ_C03717 [Eucalyptus grandis]|uniref:Uncharacterized protein n=2 Tax=Eucalyptus grandis TaxID=71139 RepID=A0ACC3LJP2_EUCGR|nr:hypothetical protein EUGRSUZ_C03717 [Eucalyptus grandis]